jgi:hypothetical protein
VALDERLAGSVAPGDEVPTLVGGGHGFDKALCATK